MTPAAPAAAPRAVPLTERGITLGAMSFFDDKGVSDWDFMVTGLWRGEGMRAGREVEFAALIPRPRLVLPPPAPADLALDFLGHHQPAAPDGPWSAATRLFSS